MGFSAVMAAALAMDVALGWPDGLYRRIGHPVTWLGRLVTVLERAMNRPQQGFGARKLAGVALLALVLAVVILPSLALQRALPAGPLGLVLEAILVWPLIAARSLYVHVRAVQLPLAAGQTGAARQAVSMIVGRDPDQLDDPAIARAALESLAENAADGIVAPVFWGVIFGLPGIAAYKAINTLDSMIGHRTPRYEAFGWASARLDDLVNLIPARLTAAFFVLASAQPIVALRCALRDARKHRSPNAGWPEAAMAGALAVRLSGPRIYHDRVADEPWLNAQAPDPAAQDLGRGLNLYRRAIALMGVALVIAALVLA